MKPEYEIVCVQKKRRLLVKKKISKIGYKLVTGETVVISNDKAIDLINKGECVFHVKGETVSVKTRRSGLLSSRLESYLIPSCKLGSLPKCITRRG